MIRYADERWNELRFTKFSYQVECRDEQWVDVELKVETDVDTPLPDDVIDYAIMAICTHRGDPLQFVVLEEGCDSEYQLTAEEKEQLEAFLRRDEVQAAIRAAAAQNG